MRIRYCYGGGVAARLATPGELDAAVICHPGPYSLASVKNIKVRLKFFQYHEITHVSIRAPLHGFVHKVRSNPFRLRSCPLKMRVEDSYFPRETRLKAEAMLVERKDKGEPLLFEFVDYRGLHILFSSSSAELTALS